MVFALCVPAFAVETQEKTAYDGLPVVIVRGIDFGGLINLDDGTKAMTIEVTDVAKLIFNLITGKFILRNDRFLQDAIIEAVWDVMGSIGSNPDGSSTDENVGMEQFYGSVDEFEKLKDNTGCGEGNLTLEMCDRIGAENVYYFTYDWRKSPEKIAEELDLMVELAKEKSGKDKVHLAALSMGGMVATAYLYYYGSASVDSIAYLSAAHNGTYVCGDALSGDIVFTPKTLESSLLFLVKDDGLNIITRLLLLVAKGLGADVMLCDLLNGFVEDSSEQAYNGALRDILGTAVGMWSLCPDETLDKARDNIFSGSEEKYAGVLSQLDELEKFTRSTEETLAQAYDSGVKLCFTSNYNRTSLPLYTRAELNSDSVIETELTSNFATVANYGETLSDEHIASVEPEYISADRIVDASTCLYPQSTWFIKDLNHVDFRYGTQVAKFAVDLILSEQQPTVDTFEAYPRFMVIDDAYNLYPVK